MTAEGIRIKATSFAYWVKRTTTGLLEEEDEKYIA